MKASLCTLALAAISVFAGPITKRHTTLQYILVNGVDQSQSALRIPGTNAPVTSVTSADLTCNVKNIGVSGVISAKAGDTITTEYHHDNSRGSEFVDPSHKGIFAELNSLSKAFSSSVDLVYYEGPMIVYLGKVSNAKTATGTGNIWIKVYEDGYTASDRKWATDRLNANGGKATFKIPSSLTAGDYLLRTEFIALQGAGQAGGAQFYVGCAQLTLTSGGSANPTGVSFPGYHTASHAGILFRLDTFPATGTYTIPGPPVYR